MSASELCRLCAKFADAKYSQSLFEQDHQKLLRQVEELIGLHLENTKDLPQHICIKCQAQTLQAHEFRESCIQAQQHLNTEEYRNQLKNNNHYPKMEILLEPDTCDENNGNDHLQEGDNDEYLLETDDVDSKESYDTDDDKPLRSGNNLHEDSGEKTSKINNLACTQCGVVSKSMSALSRHIKRHNSDNQPFACGHCPMRFHSNGECVRHTSIHGEKPYPCQHCERRYSEKTKLNAHVRRWHTNESKPTNGTENNASDIGRICDLCGKHFKSSSTFTNHMIYHSGIKRFQCELCPKKYFQKSQLGIHMYTHTGEKPFVCKICGRAFNDRSPLMVHIRHHKNDRPFVCNHCGKSFFTSVVLKAHLVTHSGAREFECTVCNMSFKLKKTLMVHYGTKGHKKRVANQNESS